MGTSAGRQPPGQRSCSTRRRCCAIVAHPPCLRRQRDKRGEAPHSTVCFSGFLDPGHGRACPLSIVHDRAACGDQHGPSTDNVRRSLPSPPLSSPPVARGFPQLASATGRGQSINESDRAGSPAPRSAALRSPTSHLSPSLAKVSVVLNGISQVRGIVSRRQPVSPSPMARSRGIKHINRLLLYSIEAGAIDGFESDTDDGW